MAVSTLFVDTSAWFEWFIRDSARNKEISEVLTGVRRRLCTSSFVVDELLTLLRARRQERRVQEAWTLLREPEIVELIHVTPADLIESYRVFEKFADKEWSFTDCSSYWLIERFKIPFACATDEHFRQFGNVVVLPERF